MSLIPRRFKKGLLILDKPSRVIISRNCSKSSDNTELEANKGPNKKPLTAKSFAARWHRRSLNPTARLIAILPPSPTNNDTASEANVLAQSEQKVVDDTNSAAKDLPPKVDSNLTSRRRKLSTEDRLKDLMNSKQDNK